MHQLDVSTNPFALMVCPEEIFAVIDRSERLERLQSRICRPLDNPRGAGPEVEVAAFDNEIEAASDSGAAADVAADESMRALAAQ